MIRYATADSIPPSTDLGPMAELTTSRILTPIPPDNFLCYGDPAKRNYKTTEYLRMKGVLDSIELRLLRRADCMKEHNILRESHVHSYKMQSVQENGWEVGGQIVCSP